MITLRRIYLESPLSADELRLRFEHAMGRSSLPLLSSWPSVSNPPFIGEMKGSSFAGTRRSLYRYAKVVGSVTGTAINAEIGLAAWRLAVAIASIIVFPIAIFLLCMIWIDVSLIEARLRELASVAR